MAARKQLQLALKTAADITSKTDDLRGIMDKMSGKNRELFKDLIKGQHIIKIFIKKHMLGELAEKIPTVTRIDDIVVDVRKLRWADYQQLRPTTCSQLVKAARDIVGRDYQRFIVDIKWMFKMLSLDAMRTVVGVMEDKKVSPQTRLSAAQDILNRAGYEGEKETTKERFPVNVVIRYDKTPESDNPALVTEGEYVHPE